MIVGWLLALSLQFLSWFLSLWSFLPTFTLPDPFSLVVPVPFLGTNIAALNTFMTVAVLVVSALVLGKVLQWAYALIPFKAS